MTHDEWLLYAATLKAERDLLLKALRRIDEFFVSPSEQNSATRCMEQMAREALAQVKE